MWPDLHWDMNLQQTYYLPITANRPDIASTLTDYVEYLQRTGNLNTNVPTQWQHDSAAAPTGATYLADLSHRSPMHDKCRVVIFSMPVSH